VLASPAIALSLALAAASPPATKGAFPYPLHRRALDNGLQVVFVPYDSPGIAAYFTVFRVGSRNEVEPGKSGFAHFFEHLSFRGTKRHSADDLERIVKSLGLDSNASTDDDVTFYWLSGPSAALPTVIELEADRFMNLAYSEDDFKIESRAVLGELLKSLASPDFKVYEAARDLAFTSHTYKHTTIGFERDVRDMPNGYRYSLDLYRRFYRPDNAMVIVVGDFDEDRTFDALQRFYGPWQGKGVPPKVAREPPQARSKEQRFAWPTPILPRLWSGWHTPGADDLDATAAQYVLWPYLFSAPSPLYRELVIEKRLVEEIGGDWQPHRDPYLFGFELVLKSPAAEAAARAAVDRAVKDLADGKVDPAWLADAKSNALSTIVMETDTPYRTGVWLVYSSALTGDPGYLDAVMARVAALRPEELSAFARRYFVPEARTTVVVATGERGKPAASARLGGAR
jgi:zinc protease